MKSSASELGLSRVKLRLKTTTLAHNKQRVTAYKTSDPGGGGTLGIPGWGCAAGTLEPLAYARVSSAEFWYPMLE